MAKIRNDVWSTYSTAGYTHDVANDQQSAGGVHHFQVRKKRGLWQERILQANGSYSAAGHIITLSEQEGLSKYEQAKLA